VKVTAEAARRFLVARHFLAPARSVAGNFDGVLEVFRKLGSIQFDPIAVAGRNHDLVLHARVAGYEPAWCDVLYERREIFEATNVEVRTAAAWTAGWLAFVVGLGYAAVSGYWASGGTELLDTVGGVFDRTGRSHGAGVALLLWLVVAIKVLAAALPLLALRARSAQIRIAWSGCWRGSKPES
jgi:hypothetical protein